MMVWNEKRSEKKYPFLRYGLFISFLVLMALLGGCQDRTIPSRDEDLRARANRLAQKILIIDTHVDLPYRLSQKMEDISSRTEGGNFDYPRAKEGGLNAPFMSIFVPSSFQERGGAKEYADELIDLIEKIVEDWPDKFALARSPGDIREQFKLKKISLPMGIENGVAIENDLTNLKHFKDRGICYVTLAHAKNNQISDSSYEKEKKWHGLSPFGKEVVAEMNRLGMIIDVTHISDEAFFQVLELSRAPVIASHSSCRKFTPGWERNMSDDMIQRLASKGGVIQINFGSLFLRDDTLRQWREARENFKEYEHEHHLSSMDKEAINYRENYWKDHPRIYGDISDLIKHIDHVVELVGVDHVGLGSDFEGVGEYLPEGVKDVSCYPNIIYELLKKGYTEEEIKKICGENLLRVWSEVERIAQKIQAESSS